MQPTNIEHVTFKATPRGRLHLFLIPLAAVLAVLPLLVHGCSCGHDFDFHILNWLEAARHFTHGDLHPQWAESAAWNAGEPRFVFYPPLSWTLGGVLGLLMPWSWTPIVYTWFVLTAAGFALHRLARSFVSSTTASLAAILYLTNPYTLFTAYERTAYAELLAAIWLPLLLHAILRPESEGGVTIPRIALPLALLWLSNAPAAVIGCYALALLAVVRLILARRHHARLAVTTVSGTVLGLGLAAFYIVPAAWERRYVQIQMAVLPGLRVRDNFLFHHTTTGINDPAALAEAVFHDNVLHTVSVIAILFLVLTAFALCWFAVTRDASEGHISTPANEQSVILGEGARNRIAGAAVEGPAVEVPPGGTAFHDAPRIALYSLVTITVVIAVLLTPISQPIWLHAPELAFLQFPWRILSLLAVVLALSVALALRELHLKPPATVALALATAAVLALPAYRLFRQPCDPEDTVAGRKALFLSNHGSEPTDEYTPTTADNDSLAQSNPPYWLAPDSNAPAPADARPGSAARDLNLTTAAGQFLILNLRNYPAWRVTLNRDSLPELEERADGLIAFHIPAGQSQIAIRYVQLPDQTIGMILTALSLAALSALLLRRPENAGQAY